MSITDDFYVRLRLTVGRLFPECRSPSSYPSNAPFRPTGREAPSGPKWSSSPATSSAVDTSFSRSWARSVSGVTSQPLGLRHSRQCRWVRSSLITVAVFSYCCWAVERPVLSSSPESLLLRPAFLFARLRDRGDELGFTPRLDGTLRGLAGGVEFPVAAGIVVRGIEDRMVEKRIAHRDGKPIAGRGARCPAHEADESGKNLRHSRAVNSRSVSHAYLVRAASRVGGNYFFWAPARPSEDG